jgi:hypothetical protein
LTYGVDAAARQHMYVYSSAMWLDEISSYGRCRLSHVHVVFNWHVTHTEMSRKYSSSSFDN